MRDLIKLPSFNALAPGSTATLDVPTVGTYHQIRLYYAPGATPTPADAATFAADITEIRLKINGKVQRRFSASECIMLNKFYGQVHTPGYLPIFFAEPHRRTAQGEDALAWGMADVATFQVEVDLSPSAVSPRLSATCIKDRVTTVMGAIKKVRKFVIPVSAIGIVNTTTLPRFDAYYSLHAKSTDIADIKVTVDARQVWEASVADGHEYIGQSDLVPQPGWTHLSWDATRRVHETLAMASANGTPISDFQIDWNMTAASSFTLLTETLGLRD